MESKKQTVQNYPKAGSSSGGGNGLALLSTLGMLLAAFLWGAAYPVLKYVADCPTLYIVALRFLTAGIVLSLVFCRHFKNISKSLVKYALILSIFNTIMYVTATLGVKCTTASKAAFLSSLCFLFVPFINLALYRTKIGANIIRSIAVCLVGVFLISYTKESAAFGLAFGDLVCIISSAAGAFSIIALESATKRPSMDAPLLAALYLLFTGVWSLLAACFTGAVSVANPTGIQILIIVLIGIFAGAAPFLLQTVSQRHVPANKTGILLAMVSPFGCLMSAVLLHESLGLYGYIGAALIILSVILTELAPHKTS